MVAAILLPSLGGLAIALALNGRGLAGNIYKSLFYLPICLSLVVIGQVWIWMYHPDWGLINTVLRGSAWTAWRTPGWPTRRPPSARSSSPGRGSRPAWPW